MKIRPVLPFVAALAFAGAAAAAGGTVTTALSPNKVSKASTLSVNATGPFSFSGLPKSAELLVQKGFKSSPKSVSVLCGAANASAGTCPANSKVGSGKAVATGSYSGFQEQDTVSLTLFLGVKQQPSDISSVVIEGTDSLFNASLHAVGRLFRSSGGGLELLFSQFPSISGLPSGTTVTLNSLQLSAGAERTANKGKGKHKHKVRYALIKNPPTCSGHWTGQFTLTFSSGTFSKALSAACKS